LRRLSDYTLSEKKLKREGDISFLSLGGGVQSSALAVLCYSDDERFPRPDYVIYGDTHADPPWTVEFLRDHLEPWLEKQGAEYIRVDCGSMFHHIISELDRGYCPLPAWGETRSGETAPLPHDCCHSKKVRPIHRKIREIIGAGEGEHLTGKTVEVWLGISAEEKHRARLAWEKWQVNRHPLIENNFTREDCRQAFGRHGLPIPGRSSCWFCPMRPDTGWKKIKENYPHHWKAICRLDETVREKMEDKRIFFHQSKKPIGKIDL